MKNISELLTDSELIKALYVLYQTPARKHSTVAKGRASFLKEAQDLLTSAPEPVSDSLLSSLKVWIKKNIPTFPTLKENNMLMKFSALVLMIAVFFGGAATAVQAADVSLPGQAMYQLKIMIEDAQETMAGPVGRVQQSMQQVETRIQEILRLRAQGKEIPETAFVLLDNQLEKTLRYMIKLSDDELIPVLTQVRTRLLAQEQKLGELQNQEQGNEDAALDRIRTMLQDRLGVIGDGTKDPQQFKLEIQDRDRDRSSWTDQGNPPANGEGSGAGPANENQGTGGPSQNGTGPGAGSGAGEPAGGPTEGGYGP